MFNQNLYYCMLSFSKCRYSVSVDSFVFHAHDESDESHNLILQNEICHQFLQSFILNMYA
jgi:hypothetical protein